MLHHCSNGWSIHKLRQLQLNPNLKNSFFRLQQHKQTQSLQNHHWSSLGSGGEPHLHWQPVPWIALGVPDMVRKIRMLCLVQMWGPNLQKRLATVATDGFSMASCRIGRMNFQAINLQLNPHNLSDPVETEIWKKAIDLIWSKHRQSLVVRCRYTDPNKHCSCS